MCVCVCVCVCACVRVCVNDKCSFCAKERDTIQHYLWFCEHVQDFWNDFEALMIAKCENCFRLKLNSELVLFGNDEKTKTNEGFEYILMLAKYFVYICKINNIRPRICMFINELKSQYKTDHLIHCMEMQLAHFHIKWLPYKRLIE